MRRRIFIVASSSLLATAATLPEVGLGAAPPISRRDATHPRLRPEPRFPLPETRLRPELSPRERLSAATLRFYNVHTRESLSLSAAAATLPAGRGRLDRFLRDWRVGAVISMDAGLISLLVRLQAALRPDQPWHVLSGYRTPETNAMLARRGFDVARNSLHLRGRALDLRLPGVPLARLRTHAMDLQAGGVGYYPDQGFLHLDTGAVRYWRA